MPERLLALSRQVSARQALLLVLGAGVVVRLLLLPLYHGQDFVVWDKASAATLQGVNIYAHHPAYPGGPYAYLPLFLYVELPFQFVAVHTGIPFTVLGKLPIIVGDVATALLIADAVRSRGGSARRAVWAAAIFLFNPLVVYNSALYGRFDSIGCALLLLAVRALRAREQRAARGAAWYGLAVAAKTFPVFAVAGVLRAVKGARLRWALTAGVVIAVLVLPYLGTWRAVYRDVVSYDLHKTAQGLSWQTLLQRAVDGGTAKMISLILLALFAVATIWLSAIADLDRYVVLTLVLLVCLSKVVLEQYLTWPLPWLAVLAVACGSAALRRGSALLFTVLTVVGCLDNETLHPFGRESTVFALTLLITGLGYVALAVTGAGQPAWRRLASGRRTAQPDAAP